MAFSGGSIESGAGGWPFSNLGDIRSNIFLTVLLIGGLICLAVIAYGAIRFILSGGDEKAKQAAQKILTAAVIGLVILVAVYPIGWILGKVLGVPITGGFNWPSAGGGGGGGGGGVGGDCYSSCVAEGCSGKAKGNAVFTCHHNCRQGEMGRPAGCYLECPNGWQEVGGDPYGYCP